MHSPPDVQRITTAETAQLYEYSIHSPKSDAPTTVSSSLNPVLLLSL